MVINKAYSLQLLVNRNIIIVREQVGSWFTFHAVKCLYVPKYQYSSSKHLYSLFGFLQEGAPFIDLKGYRNSSVLANYSMTITLNLLFNVITTHMFFSLIFRYISHNFDESCEKIGWISPEIGCFRIFTILIFPYGNKLLVCGKSLWSLTTIVKSYSMLPLESCLRPSL